MTLWSLQFSSSQCLNIVTRWLCEVYIFLIPVFKYCYKMSLWGQPFLIPVLKYCYKMSLWGLPFLIPVFKYCYKMSLWGLPIPHPSVQILFKYNYRYKVCKFNKKAYSLILVSYLSTYISIHLSIYASIYLPVWMCLKFSSAPRRRVCPPPPPPPPPRPQLTTQTTNFHFIKRNNTKTYSYNEIDRQKQQA